MTGTISLPAFDSGHLLGRHPYVRVGDGPRTLLVIPGLNDPLYRVADSWWFDSLMATFCERYAADREVYVVSRPAGLPDDLVTGDLAEGYADVLRELGPADVMGLSLGGFVVEHLAADHPELVDRAVLGLAAHRLSEAGRDRVRRWMELARAGEWGAVAADAGDLLADGWRRPLLRGAGRLYGLTRSPAVPADFIASARACLDHDAGPWLGDVAVPTLVVGGTADPFFTAAQYRRTTSEIPDARLELLPNAGHEAVIERKREFDGAVNGFLRR